MKQVTVLEAVARWLKSFDSKVIFGLPSDDLEFMESIENNAMEFVVAKDQRNAMFMTTGYALSSQHLGICNIGKGPAATNCITGILEAKNQNAPVLIIASGTDTKRYGDSKAFQEVDQMSIISPLVKWSHRVENEESIYWVIKKAIFLALNGSPGPVYIEIPEDIGRELIEMKTINFNSLNSSKTIPDPETLKEVNRLLKEAKRPVILAGGGCKRISDSTILTDFANQFNAPIFVTASGRGSVDETTPLFGGLAGLYCPDEMHVLIEDCDLFISLGSKLEETAVFGWEEHLINTNMIEININEEHFNLQFESLKLIADVEFTLLQILASSVDSHDTYSIREKMIKLKELMIQKRDNYISESEHLKVADILQEIQFRNSSKTVYVHENGLQDMWSYYYPYLSLNSDQTSIVPSEQTSLGFGCAAAIGVQKACPKSLVIGFVGDGAFNLFSADLSTLINYQIPIIYVVLKNGGYGWLEYQNKDNQASNSFVNPTIPLVNLTHSQLAVLSLQDKKELESIWSTAVKLNHQGKTVVIEATVSLEDVPTSLLNIYGDFPIKERV